MLLRMLSDVEKLHFLELADLLLLADKRILWGGKTIDQLTVDSDLEQLALEENEQDRELLTELEQTAGIKTGGGLGATSSLVDFMVSRKNSLDSGLIRSRTKVPYRLVEVLKTYPFIKLKTEKCRIQAAVTVLAELLEATRYTTLSTSKIILFELLLVALRDGRITDAETAILKEFQTRCGLEDFLYEDLLERAEALNSEMSKTLSIVLE